MKNKVSINYILINCTFFVFILYLLFKLNILNKMLEVFILIFFSIILSYIIYPIYKKLNKHINNIYSLLIIYILLVIFIFLLLYSIIPNTHFLLKIIDLFNNIIEFINKINIKYSLNINIDKYINEITKYLIDNGVFYIKNIFNYISKFIFIIIISICILINIELIKKLVSKFKYKILLYNINNKLKNFLIANLKIITIQFIEYTFIFYIIGHPNYLLLGILNSLNTFIPIFGSIISNVIAITTASVISKNLLIFTAIVSIVLPNIDAYIITPKIYKKENELSQTLSITSIIIGATLFGFYGLLFSIPILIIIIEIINYKNNAKNK